MVSLTITSSSNTYNFSWVFLLDWILMVVLSLSTFFYFGRAIAYIFTKILDLIVSKIFKVKISIQSIGISFLGGRIFVKNLTITTKDLTISILKGDLTWRYWVFQPKRPSIFIKNKNPLKNKELLSRYFINIEGLEIFVYNRTCAYENIIKNTLTENEKEQLRKLFPNIDYIINMNNETNDKDDSKDTHASSNSNSSISNSSNSNSGTHNDSNINSSDNTNNFSLKFLPIEFNIKSGSLVFGNIYTPSVLVLYWDSCNGIIDAFDCENPLDPFKMKYTIVQNRAKLTLKPNALYENEQYTSVPNKKGLKNRLWNTFKHVLLSALPHEGSHANRNKFSYHYRRGDKKINPGAQQRQFVEHWKGLSMYTNDDDDLDNFLENEVQFFASRQHEYSKHSKVVECEQVTYSYSYDIPGKVPFDNEMVSTSAQIPGPAVGNGGTAPEQRLDIELCGAQIYYGPWTHRQLMPIKKMLAPSITRDSKPATKLKPNDTRIYTSFKLLIEITDTSTLRIPTREFSKDDEFIKQYAESKNLLRPFGWIDIELNSTSSLFFDFALCPTEDEFINTFSIELKEPIFSSSVNHDIFFKADYHNITADISMPLKWNNKYTWTFNQITNNVDLFLLRDHVTLLSDLLQDFATDTEVSYELFRPYEHVFYWKFNDGYKINMNVNDANLINNPVDFNENCYLTFSGETGVIDINIPNDNIAALHKIFYFKVRTPLWCLSLSSPSWSTIKAFMPDTEVARSRHFRLDGYYQSFLNIDIGNVDKIVMECDSDNTTLICYGFAFRYFMNLQSNIFGKFTHFKTTEEFKEQVQETERNKCSNNDDKFYFNGGNNSSTDLNRDSKLEDFIENFAVKRSGLKRKSNEMDAWITFCVKDGCIAIPEYLFTDDSLLGLHFNSLEIDMRYLNYYMDLQFDMLPVYFKKSTVRDCSCIFDIVKEFNGTVPDIDGTLSEFSFHAHRLFGLPPEESTYFCKWDFSLGVLELCSDIKFFKSFINAVSKIGFSYHDSENTLIYDIAKTYDVTSLTLQLESLAIVIEEKDLKAGIDFRLSDVSLSSIDLANDKYSSRLDVVMPEISLSVFMSDMNTLTFSTHLRFTKFNIEKNPRSDQRSQLKHILMNDAAFHRCWFLMPRELRESYFYNELLGCIPPSMSIPSLIVPFVPETVDIIIDKFLQRYPSYRDLLFEDNSTDANNNMNGSFYMDDNMMQDNIDHEKYKTHEAETFIFNFGEIKLYFNISVLSFLFSLYDNYTLEDLNNLADMIEINIVKPLTKSTLGNSFIKETNFVTPKISISMAYQFPGDEEKSFDSLFNFEMENISFLCSIMKTYDVEEHKRLKYNENFTCKVFVPITKFSFENNDMKKLEKNKFSIFIEDCEVMYTKTAEGKIHVNCKSFNIFSNSSDIEQIILIGKSCTHYFSQQKKLLDKVSQRNACIKRELILQIMVASEKYNINYDPPVITRLSNIVRLSRAHVRENPSWRMVIRIRHILKHLPQSWKDITGNYINFCEYTDPHVASKMFLKVFSNWKNIEHHGIKETYIFKKLFLDHNFEFCMNECIHTTAVIKLDRFYYESFMQKISEKDNLLIKSLEINFSDLLRNTELCFWQPADRFIYSPDNTFLIKIRHIKGNLGLPTFDLKLLISKELKVLSEGTKQPSSKDLAKVSSTYQLVTLIDKIDVSVQLEGVSLVFRSFGNTLSTLLDLSHFSTVITFVNSELWLRDTNRTIFENFISNASIEYSSIENSPNFSHSLTTSFNGVSFKAMESTQVYILTYRKIMSIFTLLSKKADTIARDITKKQSKKPLKKLLLNLNMSQFDFSVQLLTAFVFNQHVDSLELNSDDLNSLSFGVEIDGYNYDIRSKRFRQTYLLYSQSKLRFSVNEKLESNSTIIDIFLSLGFIKATFADPHNVLHSLLYDKNVALKSFKLLKNVIDGESKSTQPESAKGNNKKLFNLFVEAEYIGLLLDEVEYQLCLELNSITAGLRNYLFSDDSFVCTPELLGHLSAPSICLLLKDPELSSKLSQILDFSFSCSLGQDSIEQLRTIQVESNHFRVCLCPQSFVRSLWFVDQISTTFKQLDLLNIAKPSNNMPSSPLASIELSERFKSIQVLSYDFCIGWLYNGVNVDLLLDDDADSGVVFGYNKLFSAHEEKLGKLTVVNTYFSVATGNTSSTFYLLKEHIHTFNRSFLPYMQVSYWFIKKQGTLHDLHLKISGSQLRAVIVESIMESAQKLVKSLLEVQRSEKQFMAENIRLSKGKREEEKEEGDGNSEQEIFKGTLTFLTNIQAIHCKMDYEGSICDIYSVNSVVTESQPTISLHSPKMKVAIKYLHSFENIKQPHIIKSFISFGNSDNIIYPTSVLSLHRIFMDARNLMSMVSTGKRETTTTTTKKSGAEFDYQKLLKGFDVSCFLNIKRQNLSFSCEPKAKIKAILGFDGVKVRAFTNSLDPMNSVSIALNFINIHAELQHIFSREVSTSFNLSYFDTIFILTHETTFETFATTLFQDVYIYLDLNQFQDLKLFLDIWTPHSKITSAKEETTKAVPSNFKEKIKKVSTTSGFAWNHIFIVDNMQGRVELGPSLCSLNVLNNRLSASVHHYIDWRQYLLLTVEDVKISANGRLGGSFIIQNFVWNSKIKWPVNKNDSNKNPLIYLSIGLETLEGKLSLDYHMFLISNANDLSLTLYNEHDEFDVLQDLLVASAECKKIELFTTVLATSNILNIYDTISRLHLDNRTSYDEVLKDSDTKNRKKEDVDETLANYLSLLRTDLSVRLGEFYVQVFPNTLYDPMVLVIHNDVTSAHVSINGQERIRTELELYTHNLSVKLSDTKYKFVEEQIANISAKNFIKEARKASGGTIFVFPSITISMTTWQNLGSNRIELIYSSSFGGKVSIRWNLGSINFIRELWTAHARSLSLRHDEKRIEEREEKILDHDTDNEKQEVPFFEDENFDEKLKEVKLDDKYVYEPLVLPHIETPQIKDLGGATPPIEWFGVNRQNFPGMVHQIILVPLQHLIRQSEKEYARILGSA
ncbi:Csf1p SCDLUD_001696 [Saccharomycodes ludwigii]|uniref:Csf1p n=1 Tax=Saccharomycodes ludwigii TaxID=36035 RepID=UPI001E85D6F7|nr:hypothetical protein SCDLUD_001696 [Saccharomycodes ludwigii]KAH3901912.1 hypothetical protein SCDLUD_001696 [Saccharomycodes ludwigii]